MNILVTHQLRKVYDGTEVVKDINMTIKKGQIYGFLGPNGAGKTTTMMMIANLIKPTAGSIEVFGEELNAKSYSYFSRVGALIESPVFYNHLSACDNLKIHLGFMGLKDVTLVDEALESVELTGTGDRPVGKFSLGMKQRLGIARALMGYPEFLMLDEPINGLDPMGIKQIREMLRGLSRDKGMTILISSHILSEVEQLVDCIGIINEGRLIREVNLNDVYLANTSLEDYFTEIIQKEAILC